MDLRQLIAGIELAGELERIADYAKGIARIVMRDGSRLPAELPPAITALAEQAIALLEPLLTAIARGGPNSLEPSARPLVPNDLLDYALETARIPQHCRQAALDIFFGRRP